MKRTLCVLVALVALGCGARRPAAERPPIHACDLLTLDEADPKGADVLMPVGNAVDSSVGASVAKCAYGTSDLPVRVVGVEVRRFASPDSAESEQRAARGMLRGLAGADAEPVAGLGDDAAWAGGRLNQLHVRAGDLRLIVSVEVGDEAKRKARAQEIAARALSRLTKPGPA